VKVHAPKPSAKDEAVRAVAHVRTCLASPEPLTPMDRKMLEAALGHALVLMEGLTVARVRKGAGA